MAKIIIHCLFTYSLKDLSRGFIHLNAKVTLNSKEKRTFVKVF
jgi:hypothetical protein